MRNFPFVTGLTAASTLEPLGRWWPRVEIGRPFDGALLWVDVTPYWRGWSWTDDVDREAPGGTLRFRRDWGAALGGGSLAPLVQNVALNTAPDGTYDPLFTPFRPWRLRAARTAPAAPPPPEAHYLTVATGALGDPSWGGAASVLEVPVRDPAAVWQDAIIEVPRVYGSAAGTPILDVLHAILADNGFPAVGVTQVGDPQGWSLRPYTQRAGVSVWSAMQALALQMGWGLRVRGLTADAFTPVLQEPLRELTAPHLVVPPSGAFDVSRVVLNGTDVRNAGRLAYVDAATQQRAEITREDADSIARFGRRAFGLPVAPNIDTAAEAAQYLEAVVADLAVPYLDGGLVLPFVPVLELGDVLRLPSAPAYDRYFRGANAAPLFGVAGLRHEWTVEKDGTHRARTTVALRGRPVAAYQQWLTRARRGLPPAASPTPTQPAPGTLPLTVTPDCTGGAPVNRLAWPALPAGVAVDVLRDGQFLAGDVQTPGYDDETAVAGQRYAYTITAVTRTAQGATTGAGSPTVTATTRSDCVSPACPNVLVNPAIAGATARAGAFAGAYAAGWTAHLDAGATATPGTAAGFGLPPLPDGLPADTPVHRLVSAPAGEFAGFARLYQVLVPEGVVLTSGAVYSASVYVYWAEGHAWPSLIAYGENDTGTDIPASVPPDPSGMTLPPAQVWERLACVFSPSGAGDYDEFRVLLSPDNPPGGPARTSVSYVAAAMVQPGGVDDGTTAGQPAVTAHCTPA